MGRPPEKIVGSTVEELTASEDWPGNWQLLRRMLAEGEPSVLEKRYIRADGRAVWTCNSFAPQRDASGHIVGTIAVVMDVTERKRAEERLQLATDAASLGIFDVNLFTGVTEWDARLHELWGTQQTDPSLTRSSSKPSIPTTVTCFEPPSPGP